MKPAVILKGLAICATVWAAVFAAQGYFRGFRVTAERVEEAVGEADLADWSERAGEPAGPEAVTREKKIREVAKMISQLDFRESGKARKERVADEFFWKLSPKERALFVNLTMEAALDQWMAAFEGMSDENREKFIKRGLKELDYELNPENLERMEQLGEEIGEIAKAGGFREYLKGMTVEEKMEVAPLLEIMNELMKRLRMPKWEGREDGGT